MNNQNQRHPNFLIGGTAAGGTSFLSSILVQHPEIYLPKQMRPEPHFFYKSWEFEKGPKNYLDQWFGEVPERCIAVGERSSSYLFGGSAVAKRIAHAYPEMRFIFTLRNPIERTWANYRYTVLEGLETLSFEDALLSEEARISEQEGVWAEIQPHNYTGRGLYAEQLLDYLHFFPAENLLIIQSEALAKDTELQLARIYEFLGLNTLELSYRVPPNHTSVNVVDPVLQARLRQQFGANFDAVIECVRKDLDFNILRLSDQHQSLLSQLKSNLTPSKFEMSDWARAYLDKFFQKDLSKLENLVEFDISDWRG